MRTLIKIFTTAVLAAVANSTLAQNPLFIPSTLSGTTFNLNVQKDTTEFYPGIFTPTYGVNGPLLAPTLIFNQGDNVTLNVTNNLNTSTTMHWHGIHLPAIMDGGPHQVIFPGQTWSPQFTVLNNAATYWYHPHGEGKTDLQVSKGIAGIIIVKDPVEAALDLPRTYGVDDFPLIVQSKAFDILYQIAIGTDMDTAVFVNGTWKPYLNVPAQTVRLRLLNGSSLRTFYFGLSTNANFYQIATDGGLVEQPVVANRLRLSPGERVEVLVDLNGMQGDTIYWMNYGSELTNGIYGSPQVGMGMSQIPDYDLNSLNGADYNLLQLNVGPQTATPVTTIPTNLVDVTEWNPSNATVNREIVFAPQDMAPEDMVMGPFTMNGVQFNIDTVNIVTYKNTTEIWTLKNNTLLAHPFHIHDIQFNLLFANGDTVPAFQQGWKDVVLVMPMDSVAFITKFENFADTVPYMHHCHLLHHEDDGMMASFVVLDSASLGVKDIVLDAYMKINPNPAADILHVNFSDNKFLNEWSIVDLQGKALMTQRQTGVSALSIDVSALANGMYILKTKTLSGILPPQKFIVQH